MHTPTCPVTCIHAHTDKYVILISFPRQQLFAKASHCYVMPTLPVLLFSVLTLQLAHVLLSLHVNKLLLN